jgi:hypothetical protein
LRLTHPSLPECLSRLSGSFQGIWDDCKTGTHVECGPAEFVPGADDVTDGSYLTVAQIASAFSTPRWLNVRNLVNQIEARPTLMDDGRPVVLPHVVSGADAPAAASPAHNVRHARFARGVPSKARVRWGARQPAICSHNSYGGGGDTCASSERLR